MLRILYHLRARFILTLRCTESVSCSAVLMRFSHFHRQAPENGYHPCSEHSAAIQDIQISVLSMDTARYPQSGYLFSVDIHGIYLYLSMDSMDTTHYLDTGYLCEGSYPAALASTECSKRSAVFDVPLLL